LGEYFLDNRNLRRKEGNLMKRMIQRALAGMLAAALLLGNVATASAAQISSPGSSGNPGFVIGGDSTNPGGDSNLGDDTVNPVQSPGSGLVLIPLTRGKAAIIKVPSQSGKSYTLKSTVTYKNKKYKITRISANTFSRNKQLTSITLPSTIRTINKNAFAGLSKLKTINLNVGRNITVKKGAFGGISTKNMTIKVKSTTSSRQLKKLKATFKKAGFLGTVKRA
jgi:hypothetical protein